MRRLQNVASGWSGGAWIFGGQLAMLVTPAGRSNFHLGINHMYLASLPSSSWIPHLFSQGFYSQPLKRSPSAFPPLFSQTGTLALTPFFSLSKLIYLRHLYIVSWLQPFFCQLSPCLCFLFMNVLSHFQKPSRLKESRALLPSQRLYFSAFSTYPLMSKWAEWLLLMKEMWAGEFCKDPSD